MSVPVRAAVVGLGNVGFLFDLDDKRDKTWSHSRAYSLSPRTELAAVVEPDADKVRLFGERYPGVPAYESIEAMFAAGAAPELVSLCVPTALHAPVLMDLLRHPVRGVVCEKPFAPSLDEAREMVAAARERDVLVAVNHTRRWTATYMAAADAVARGDLGELKALRAVYPGQVYNIGSHVLDVLAMICGRPPVAASGLKVPGGGDDPHIAGRVLYEGGLSASFDVTGKRERLVLEIDAIGERGRIVIRDNGRSIDYYKFEESAHYAGYEELGPANLDAPLDNDPFVEMVTDVAAALADGSHAPRCTACDGYDVMAAIDALVRSASAGGAFIPLHNERGIEHG